jgi:hypothetical protein
MNARLRIDRTGLSLAILVAIAYFALGSPWPLAFLAALLVYSLKAVLDLPVWHRRRNAPGPTPGSPEALWLERAERAIASIRQLRRSARSDDVARRCAGIAAQGELTLGALRRLTYQAGVVAALTRSREIDGTVTSLGARQQTAQRLETTRRELQARIENSVLGLEGVVARLAEIVALSDGAGGAPVEELVFELDTLRTVLVETEELGRHSFHALTEPIDERKVT